MNYRETLEFLYNSLPVYQRIGKAAYKANLDTTIDLDNYFGNPHSDFKTIHIAGTNGKGSLSHMLASVLAEAGYKTGLYTSPHIRDFRERIKIYGKPVPEDYIVSFIGMNLDIIERLKPSFFEMTVALAFKYFSDCDVDVAVIETGMGGRLDSTNIIIPEVSVITNIGFDHMQFLGGTLEQIATEKGGIIKPGVPVVIGESNIDTKPVFARIAFQNNSELIYADSHYKVVIRDKQMQAGKMNVDVYREKELFLDDLELDVSGSYQVLNLQTFMSTIDILCRTFSVDRGFIRKGLMNITGNTGLEGRWQIIRTNPLVICDTAHNADGLKLVLEQLKQVSNGRLHFVLGFVSDKDIKTLLSLFPADADYYFTRADIPRSLNHDELLKIASEIGLKGSAIESVPEAYSRALVNAGSDSTVFIGGSTFIVADLLVNIGDR
ncbi:MAG TPA: folylpolyglutamate synthase/dihydrofolate synthase family protein [Bacteroidales bacterium]|nr:folylpolyglutamate synthase/dihydrofolate synthase family protein [Bacteroidales bacterium]